MTDLAEHAKSTGGPEIVRTEDLPQRPAAVIQSAELIDCDELTPEDQFPEFGKFLKMELPNGDEEYWECTGSLAGTVMEIAEENGLEPEGAVLDVSQVSKTPSGEWRFVAAVSESD